MERLTRSSRLKSGKPFVAVLNRYRSRLLSNAVQAFGRLGNAGNREAMHDFRVAVRRLRTWLRVVRVPNDGTQTLRHKLRDLAHSTNHTRDLEIEIRWLAAQRSGCAASERPALTQLLKDRRCELKAAASRNRRHLSTQWPLLLKSARALVLRVVAHDHAQSLDAAVSTLIKALRKIRTHGDDAQIHHARICAKRARYLLEPYRKSDPAVAEAASALVRIQDDFGHYHDRTVFMHALREVARRAQKGSEPLLLRNLAIRLRRVARAEQRELFQSCARDHLHANIGALARKLREVVQNIQAAIR